VLLPHFLRRDHLTGQNDGVHFSIACFDVQFRVKPQKRLRRCNKTRGRSFAQARQNKLAQFASDFTTQKAELMLNTCERDTLGGMVGSNESVQFSFVACAPDL
jgi:hypothetical protein